MTKNKLDKDYWEERYASKQIGWDINQVSPPIKAYIDQLADTTLKILVPGSGNSHELGYLWTTGFKNSYALDIAQAPLDRFKKRHKDFPVDQLLNQDFFKLNDRFDIIFEQTFFCALQPNLRADYVQKMSDLLKPQSLLVGLLFDFPLTPNGPPFGGDLTLYKSLFSDVFNINTLEPAINSIKERQGKELFFIFEKK